MSIIRNGFESADLDVPVVLPTLNLDFANSQSLDSRITFTRVSIGTRVNRNGLIETIAANQPRFDFDPISGECRGLLIEESMTNLLTYSEDFTNANWSKSQSSIITTSIVAPNGSTAYKLVENTVSGVGHFITQGSITKLSNAVLTLTIFAKAAERQYLGLVINSSSTGFANRYGAEFNLGNGTASEHDSAQGTYTSGSYSITPYPNGWYRCRITCTTSTDAQTQVRIFAFRDANQWTSAPTYAGDGTSGLYCWGAQLETGAFPTSYIPTTASTVTRSADLASITGTNFSSWYNQTEGSVYCRYDRIGIQAASTGSPTPWGLSDGTANNSMSLIGGVSAPNSRRFDIVYQNVANVQLIFSTTEISNRFYKSCVGYATNNASGSYEGGAVLKDTSCLIPIVNILFIGKRIASSSTDYLNGHISRLAYYPKALSPAELQYLTT